MSGKETRVEAGNHALPRFCRARGCRACCDLRPALEILHDDHATAKEPDLAASPGKPQPRLVGVAVVDHDPRVRTLHKEICAGSDEFHCCGSFSTAADALRALPGTDFGILLMGIELPDLCGIRCAAELLACRPELKLLITSSRRDPRFIRYAWTLGAGDYLLRPVSLWQCLASLRFAAASLHYTSRSLVAPAGVSGGEEWTQNRWFEKGPGVSAEGGMKKAGGFLHRPASA